jgi:hypothetical protein
MDGTGNAADPAAGGRSRRLARFVGFTNGIAVLIAVSQIRPPLGYSSAPWDTSKN